LKKDLTPDDFGREVVRLGFRFGVFHADDYLSTGGQTPGDIALIEKAKSNPGMMQLLYANLVSGAFYCYAKVLLRVSPAVLTTVEAGMLSALIETMPALGREMSEHHKLIITGFARAIESQIRGTEPDPSALLLIQYACDFYLSDQYKHLPETLAERLSGFGSTFMAICQDDFRLTASNAQ
jgi:hypothetical protein